MSNYSALKSRLDAKEVILLDGAMDPATKHAGTDE
ncbi:MAG: hypothetical protein CM1200mP39_25380 [Dehalococcoidia bacterium]|nr:MAG: hypothetical protein CM1200mP39_25380 [Dehalococcoidia bacterium]